MKRIIAMLAMVTMAPLAQADTDFSWDGESRTRFEHLDNTNLTDNGSQETIVHRMKLGLTAKKGEQWTGKVTLLHNYDFGSDSADGNSASTTQDGVGVAGVEDNALLVNEAYFHWMLNESWTFAGGRRGIEWADGTVLGRNEWQATPTSWDGVSAHWDHDMFKAEILWNKTVEETTSTGVRASDAEGKVWGAGFNFKNLPEQLKVAHIHVLNQSNDELVSGTAGVDVIRYGVTLGGDTMGVMYNLTYAAHSGSFYSGGAEGDLNGNMIDAKLGYGMDNWGVHFGYHMDSGDDDATDGNTDTYQDLASNQHGQAGLMDIFRYGNLTSLNFGAHYKMLNDTLTLGVDYWIFSQTEAADTTNYGLNGGLMPAAGNADEDALGSEIDLTAIHSYGNGMEITARVGIFTPGDEYTDDETFTQYFVEARMPF